MTGGVDFTKLRSITTLESSTTYNELKDKHSINGGIGGFCRWLASHPGNPQVENALKELSYSDKVDGAVHIDMSVSGLYPNTAVPDASFFFYVLQIEDNRGTLPTWLPVDVPRRILVHRMPAATDFLIKRIRVG